MTSFTIHSLLSLQGVILLTECLSMRQLIWTVQQYVTLVYIYLCVCVCVCVYNLVTFRNAKNALPKPWSTGMQKTCYVHSKSVYSIFSDTINLKKGKADNVKLLKDVSKVPGAVWKLETVNIKYLCLRTPPSLVL